MLTSVVPNPANPSASIEFSLANDVTVHLDLYNLAGRHIRTLTNRRMQSGDHTVTWNGRNENGAQVATGIYVASFRAGGVSSTMKIILVR